MTFYSILTTDDNNNAVAKPPNHESVYKKYGLEHGW